MTFLYIFLLSWGCTAQYYTDRGQKSLEMHDLSKAEQHFRQALGKEPRRIDALVGLGWTYQLAGEKDAAAKVFERCRQFQPSAGDCLRGRASVHLSQGQLGPARQLIEKALRHHPEDAGVLSSAALLWMTEGDLVKAEKSYTSLALRYPKKAEYQLGRGEAMFRQGKYDEVVGLMGKALRIKNTPVRYRAMLWSLQARSLLKASAGKEDAANCEATAKPVLAWIKAAEEAVQQAEKTGVTLPDLPILKRQVLRRRAVVLELCPKGGSEGN